MEEPDRNFSAQASSSSSSSNRVYSGAATASSSSFPVAEEAEDHDDDQHSQFVQPQAAVSYQVDYGTAEDEAISRFMRDDSWSCIVVVLTFWFFVSVTLILGVYGSVNLQLGPNSSVLITPNPLFVKYIKVEQLDEANTGPTLYGLYDDPPCDVVTNWSQTRTISLPAGFHKEWIYVLNEGSQINISYNSTSSSSLILIIAQGMGNPSGSKTFSTFLHRYKQQ
jgi:hypothetical protein